MTNTKAAANYLASKGRYGDSTLVHMSPIEVWALERMSPKGQLPRNPDTGLPEAFDLGDILPAVVGIGGAMMGLPTWALALGSGLTTYGTTGDLGKGLMSGLLSYGVGSALDSLANPAAQAATDATTQAATQTGSAAASNAASNAATNTATQGLQQSVVANPSAIFSAPAAQAAPLTGFDAVTGAFKNVTGPGGADLLKSTFVDNFKSTTLPIAGSILGSMAMEPSQPFAPVSGSMGPTSKELQRRYPEQFPGNPGVRFPGSDYIPGTSGEFDYFANMAEGGLASLMGSKDALYAKGGIADPDGEKATKANIEAEAKMALMDHHPKAAEALARYERAFGVDALEDLRSRVRPPGGRIRGAGGGLDDLIPGTIEGRKDVRLADGEFVVPADVVSMLGDGSSDHGVRKLHEMMDRVRVQKTGTKKQAKPTKDGKVLPA